MADKKLTDVEIISSASGSDSLILIKNGVTKSRAPSINLGFKYTRWGNIWGCNRCRT